MKKTLISKPGTNEKRPYHRPVLTDYGELRTLTLEASTYVDPVTGEFRDSARVVSDEERGGRAD